MGLMGVGATAFVLVGALLRVLDKATIARLMQRDI